MATIRGTNDDDRNLDGTPFNDAMNGFNGNDVIHGLDGNDRIVGGQGNDDLHGGLGDDVLVGGFGADDLWGGAGADVFVITAGSSPASSGAAGDVIRDWNANADNIDMPGTPGMPSNYAEESFTGNTLAAASSYAGLNHSDSARYVFLYNDRGTGKGFLVADLNADGTFETGIVINRAGAESAMDWSNII